MTLLNSLKILVVLVVNLFQYQYYFRCFAIDRSGFVVIHKDFLDNPPRAQVHVTTKEPQVAADLVQNRIMRNDSCVSYADITNQLFWEVRTLTRTVLLYIHFFCLTIGHKILAHVKIYCRSVLISVCRSTELGGQPDISVFVVKFLDFNMQFIEHIINFYARNLANLVTQ